MDETPQEKKLRLAKLYLEELRQHGESPPGIRCRRPGGAAPGAEPGLHGPCPPQRRSGQRRRRRRPSRWISSATA